MRFIEAAERQVRDLGRDIVPPPIKRQLWFYYMEGKRMVETRTLDMFGQVHLEVNTDCNRACSYCSVSVFPKTQKLIDMELYQKVIDELVGINYRGRISPNLSSEPMLHPRLPELMEYARRVKNARLVLYTNGDFLDRRRFDILKKTGVDEFIITQHGENAPKPLTELMESLADDEMKMVTYQTLAGVNLFNRGIPGLIPSERRTVPNPCFVADYELTVLVNGEVAQCGNDFRGEHVFGNVRDGSIMNIWNSPDYKTFRTEVRRSQFNHDVCQRCVFDVSQQTIPSVSDYKIQSVSIS